MKTLIKKWIAKETEFTDRHLSPRAQWLIGSILMGCGIVGLVVYILHREGLL